jgi:hydroxymethylpyrimidine/phosphomethylpyrimidine kinase
MTAPAGTRARLLSIAGSDSGGGAGIQADIKAFAACGVHGMTAITAVTAQNTHEVTAVYQLPGEAIVEQVRAVVDDIGVDAVKVGMLGNIEAIEAVDRALDLLSDGTPVVIDPVMVAESGARLLAPEAERSLKELLLPRASVVTPNLMEAAVLAGLATDAAPAVHALGCRAVVVTGGHRDSGGDVFFDGRRLVEIVGERHPGGGAHGSGCTHSSVLAAQLGLGMEPLDAARRANTMAAAAVAAALRGLGAGAGPVDALSAVAGVPRQAAGPPGGP